MTEPSDPDSSSDERPIGWGDEHEDPSYDDAAAQDERLLAERPPHHDRSD